MPETDVSKGPPPATPRPRKRKRKVRALAIRLPVATIAKILFTIVLVWAALKLWPLLLTILVAMLLAITLYPALERLERLRISRHFGIVAITVLVIGAVAFIALVVVPPLAVQLRTLTANLPQYREGVHAAFSRSSPVIDRMLDQLFLLPSDPSVRAWFGKPLVWGTAAAQAIIAVFLVVVFTLYLLVDGNRFYAWLLAYVPRRHRGRMAQTVPEVTAVIRAFVTGQLLVSFLFGSFTFVLLTIAGVPAALPLALVASACDVVPIVGIVVATIPAVLLALTVSPLTAGVVLGAYAGYHTLENYYILPRIYGRRLRLSPLAVLLALAVGATLHGIIGAVLILPFVAAYPIIERIWLSRYLGDDVIGDHSALQRASETGIRQAVDAVLRGEPTRSEPRSDRARE